MEKLNDAVLYDRVKHGDQSALELLYDRYEKILYSFAFKLTSNIDVAEEVVQEVFIKLWKGRGIYDETKGKFSSWILTIARNTAIDLIRKRKDQPFQDAEVLNLLADENAHVEGEVEWQEERERIKRAVSQLSTEQQEVIDYVYFKGFTQQKIAESRQIPLGTVKGRIRLALKNLRQYLVADHGRRGDA